MDENVFDQIHEVDLKSTMESSYIEYAMSVIASRALPDVRDGLKPVQRRILYSMVELNNTPDKAHRKCARIVGDTMGKYHPHGDSSIYGALVCMAQDWNYRYTLVDGHGNFGSVDGDGAAAMRYTEARLSKVSMQLLRDLNQNTVDFVDNFDGTEKEPVVLPSRYPNLLVNGANGIAVGMATNIPPHNLREVIAAVNKIIDNKVEGRETTIEEVMEIVKAPDFPTGAMILGKRGIEEAYRTGRGKLKVRAVTNIETMENGKSRIIVTELPYMVNKAKLIEKIAELVKDKKIDGITGLRDETNKEGMRIVIEVRRDVSANIVLNHLYKHTQMQDSFGVIMLALVNNEPKVLTLLDMLRLYLKHQEEVVTRRTRFLLEKAEARAHIVEGLLIALDNIDEVVKIIRAAHTTQDAKNGLIERFNLTDIQAQNIVDMRLRQLTGLAREDLEAEYAELQEKIAYYKSILEDESKLLSVIKEEITIISNDFGDDRRTKIGIDDDEIEDIDLIPDENVVIAKSNLGYIKRMTVDNFETQHRGGKGIKGMQTIENDFIEDLLMTNTHNNLMFITNKGRAYKLMAYEIPEAGRTARGTAIINLLQLQPDEKVQVMLPVSLRDIENRFFIMVTKNGTIKKTPISEFKNIRKGGIIAIDLRDEDELVEVKTCYNSQELVIVTKFGQCIRIKASDVRRTGRSSIGVRGINLKDGDEVVGMQLNTQGKDLLFVTEKGMGKRTPFDEFTVQHRGGKGVKCYKITEKTGNVVGVKAVNDDHEIMLITNEGIIIQIGANDVSEIGRITSGVRLMKIDKDSDTVIAKIAKVREDIKQAITDDSDEGEDIPDEDFTDDTSLDESENETEENEDTTE